MHGSPARLRRVRYPPRRADIRDGCAGHELRRRDEEEVVVGERARRTRAHFADDRLAERPRDRCDQALDPLGTAIEVAGLSIEPNELDEFVEFRRLRPTTVRIQFV
jgi:hypothetical protein